MTPAPEILVTSDSTLPQGWALSSLENLTELLQYGHTASAINDPNGPRFLRITDIQNGNVDWMSVPACEANAEAVLKYALHPGDIVFARTGATTGKSYLIRSCPTDAIFASYLIRLRLREPIEPAFVQLFFQTPRYWDFISGNVSGNAQPGCNASKLSHLQIPIPPLAEQRRIVEKVDQLLARVTAAREHLGRVPGILKCFRQAVLTAACSGRLTDDWRLQHEEETAESLVRRPAPSTDLPNVDEHLDGIDLPESWLSVRVDAVVRIQNGRSFPSKQYRDEGIRLLRPGNLHVSGRVEWTAGNTAFLPKFWAKECPEFLLGKGELLMNLTAQSLKDEFLGRVCIKEDTESALLNQRIARLIPYGGFDVRPYLLLYFKSRFFRSFVNELDTGSLIRHIHSKDVARYVIPLPPLDEQREIVRRVDALLELADAVEKHLDIATERTESLTQAILTKALRGELVPTEAELARREGRDYDPASALLERIKAQRDPEKPSRRPRARDRVRKA